MVNKNMIRLLESAEFVSLGTSDLEGRPKVAPKFLLKLENNFVYLIDHAIGNTLANLKANPRASLAVMDIDALTGYQINGSVRIIDKGEEYDSAVKEFSQKQTNLSAMRIIEGVEKGKKHRIFELEFPEQVIIYKVKIEEVVVCAPQGILTREKVGR